MAKGRYLSYITQKSLVDSESSDEDAEWHA